MKIHLKKTGVYKLLFYVLLSYLIATWGVNHVINPAVYIRQLSAEVVPASQISEDEYLKFTTDTAEEEYPYLLFDVTESSRYYQTLSIQKEDGSASSIEVSRGTNCFDIRDYGRSILFSQKDLTKNEVIFDNIAVSTERYVDIPRSLSVFASFLVFSAAWEFIQYIKKRYTR